MEKFFQKLQRIAFFLLVFLLPTQLGRHFWPSWSYVLGLRVDYLSPTVYLTDILVAGILGLWGIEEISKIKNQKLKTHIKNLKNLLFLFSIFAFLLVNALLAQNPGAAFYKFVKIVEFTLLGFYIAKNRYQLSAINYQLSFAVIYSSLIALFQFLKQASLDGIFWWLGERTFNASTPGIAKAVLNGRLIMRPYATFPHPNVLAGFILVTITLLLGSFKLTNQIINKFKRNWLIGIYWILVFILALIGLVISFSRSAWLVGFIVGLWVVGCGLWGEKRKVFNLVFLVLLLVLVSALFYFGFQLSSEEAVIQRLQLTKAAISMIKTSPVMGVGLNNFIVRLPEFWQTPETIRFLQPVHNIFLLVAAEAGLVGLMIFLWFLILTFKNLLGMLATRDAFGMGNWKLVIPLLAILLPGVVDHYWLTLQQSQLLFVIVLGLSWAKRK